MQVQLPVAMSIPSRLQNNASLSAKFAYHTFMTAIYI